MTVNLLKDLARASIVSGALLLVATGFAQCQRPLNNEDWGSATETEQVLGTPREWSK